MLRTHGETVPILFVAMGDARLGTILNRNDLNRGDSMTTATPSPFPGMDPFLESPWRWPTFHGWFMHRLASLAMPKAIELGCWIDVKRDVYLEDYSGEVVTNSEPDEAFILEASNEASCEHDPRHVSVTVPHSVSAIGIDPQSLRQHRQHYLVVRENPTRPRALAVVELLSPANKSGSYARTYNAKRAKYLASLTHFMEIDLLRGGDNPLRGHFPDLDPTYYFVFVARKNTIGRNEESFPLRLQDRLPTIGLPLWGNRPDLPLDLGEAFRSAYDLTTGGRPINYAEEAIPEPPLAPEDATWIADLIKTKG